MGEDGARFHGDRGQVSQAEPCAAHQSSGDALVPGTPPFKYQWLRNTQPIAGATNSTYVIPAVALFQNGLQYSVQVSNLLTGATSQAGTLTVNSADINTGLVGYWTFDETSGLTAADSTTNDDVVTLHNFLGDDSSSRRMTSRSAIGTSRTSRRCRG